MNRRPDTVVDAWLQAWPDLSVGALDAALAAVVDTIPALLAGHPAMWARATALAPAPSVALFVTGLGPWLGAAHRAGHLTTDPEGAALLRAHLAGAHARAAHIDRALVPVLDAFRRRTVPVVVFKGAQTRVYFPDHARSYVDVDVLVPAEAVDRAHHALDEMGWHLVDATAAPDRWTWSPTPAQWVPPPTLLDQTVPWQLDVHATLDRVLPVVGRQGFGQPAFDGPPWAGHAWARTLSAPMHFALLAFHASSHHPTLQLVRIVELVFFARAEKTPAFWDAVRAAFDEHNTWIAAYPALELAQRFAPDLFSLPFRVAMERAVPTRVRRAAARRPVGRASDVLAPPWARRLQYAATPGQRLWAVLELAWPRRDGRWMGAREFLSSRWRLLRWTVAWCLRRGSTPT